MGHLPHDILNHARSDVRQPGAAAGCGSRVRQPGVFSGVGGTDMFRAMFRTVSMACAII